MAEMQNTGNALPSNDLRDLNDNLITIDNQVNSEELVTTDRFGRTIITVKGMEKRMEELASNIATNKLVPIDGSRSADKLTLKDGDSTLALTASDGELLVGDKQALLVTETDGVKTVAGNTNFTGLLKKNGSVVTSLSDFSVNTTDNKNRYFTLPSGDPAKPIIIQTGVSNGTGSRLYTYPTAFPNNLFCLVVMTAGQGGDFATKDIANTPNVLTQMKLVPYNASSGSITTYAVEMHILAIGN